MWKCFNKHVGCKSWQNGKYTGRRSLPAFFNAPHRNIKMQGCAFSVTIRPSASDSIILEVSRGMWMARSVRGVAWERRNRRGWLLDGVRVLEVPQWTVMGQVEGSLAILKT